MRKSIAIVGLGFVGGLAVACGSSGSIMCGEGTVEEDNQCVPTTPQGSGVTCGSGTMLDPTGTMCIGTGSGSGSGSAGAPTITMITPSDAGVTGNVLFEIDGTNLAGNDPTMVHVYFGDTTPGTGGMLGPCEAEIGLPQATAIVGEVPLACDLSVTVTVQTDAGMATTPFAYDALFAADGDDTDFPGAGGNLWVIDPFAGQAYTAGPMVDAAMATYNVDALAFGSDGTLYGVTTGNSAGDMTAGGAQLVTLALGVDANGLPTATVTVVGPIVDAAKKQYTVSDMKFSGTTLYGWGYITTGTTTTTTKHVLLSIDPTTGVVTTIGTAATDRYDDSGLAVDGTGTVYVAPNSASSTDATGLVTATGVMDTVNTTTGALTKAATLDYGISAPVTSMVFIGTALVATIDDGAYDYTYTGGLVATHGVTFALIDPSAMAPAPVVTPLFEMPAPGAEESHISAMDMAPAAVSIAAQLRVAHWSELAARSGIPAR